MRDITQATFDELTLDVPEQGQPVVLDFWAEWCGPCKAAMPKLEAMEESYDGDVLFYKANVDKESKLAQKYAVRSIPTFVILVDGEVVEVISADVKALEAKLDELLK